MNIENLRIVRNILFRTFLSGLIIVILFAVATMSLWDFMIAMANQWFHTTEAVLTPIVIKFFVDIRFYLVFVILAPALGIHWTIKKEESRAKST